MRLPTSLLALSALTLCACSTLQERAPAEIPPPSVVLASPCETPPDLQPGASGQDLAEWAARWVGAAGCERAKRRELLQAWPR